MSKHYNRSLTPLSPPPRSRNSSHSSKSYSIETKPYSSREYGDRSTDKYERGDKYSQYDKYSKFDNYEKYSKYDKNGKEKNNQYDKYEKSDFKSPYSGKDYDDDYSLSLKKGKLANKYAKGDLLSPPFKSKGSTYTSPVYSDQDSFSNKFSSRNNETYDSKYSQMRSDKFIRDMPQYSDESKKYDQYSSKSSSYSKYDSLDNSYFDSRPPDYDSYSGYGSKCEPERGKMISNRGYGSYRGGERDYVHDEYSNSDSYQRYVIGDSVVYGSPGHNPEDLYPPSPKMKRKSLSPQRISSSKLSRTGSASKNYSKYSPSSPKRLKGSSGNGGSFSRSPRRISPPFRKPQSPLLPPRRSLSPPRYSRSDRFERNFSPPPQRGKDDRFEYPKQERGFNQGRQRGKDSGDRSRSNVRNRIDTHRSFPDSNRIGRGSLIRSSFQEQSGRRLPPNRNRYTGAILPRPTSPPKPLLSIPLTESSLPKGSREKYRQILSHADNVRPIRGRDRDRGVGRNRRIDGRIRPLIGAGRSQLQQRKRPLSPRDKRKRRPDDLRLWIESRKSESSKKNQSPNERMRGSGHKVETGGGKSRIGGQLRPGALIESRKRMLAKGRRLLPAKRAPLKKIRKLAPSGKSKDKEDSSKTERKPRSPKRGDSTKRNNTSGPPGKRSSSTSGPPGKRSALNRDRKETSKPGVSKSQDLKTVRRPKNTNVRVSHKLKVLKRSSDKQKKDSERGGTYSSRSRKDESKRTSKKDLSPFNETRLTDMKI